jgi:hypothetical protein
VQHPKSLFKVEFTRFMAQPFMQLHSKWMKVRGGGGQRSICMSLNATMTRCQVGRACGCAMTWCPLFDNAWNWRTGAYCSDPSVVSHGPVS